MASQRTQYTTGYRCTCHLTYTIVSSSRTRGINRLKIFSWSFRSRKVTMLEEAGKGNVYGFSPWIVYIVLHLHVLSLCVSGTGYSCDSQTFSSAQYITISPDDDSVRIRNCQFDALLTISSSGPVQEGFRNDARSFSVLHPFPWLLSQEGILSLMRFFSVVPLRFQ